MFAARLAELENDLLALDLTQLRVVASSADGKPNPASSLLKLRGSELQQAATELLMDVAGPDSLPVNTAEIDSPEWAQQAAPRYLNYRKVPSTADQVRCSAPSLPPRSSDCEHLT